MPARSTFGRTASLESRPQCYLDPRQHHSKHPSCPAMVFTRLLTQLNRPDKHLTQRKPLHCIKAMRERIKIRDNIELADIPFAPLARP
jgi:hypothetical protein